MILFVSASPRALECAQYIEHTVQKPTVLCASMKAAWGLCVDNEFLIAVLDQASTEANPSDITAVPRAAEYVLGVYINTAVMSAERIANEVRGAIFRLERERRVAMHEAGAAVRNEVRNEITGVLLAVGLALDVPGLPPLVVTKLRDIQRLANRMRVRLESAISNRRPAKSTARQPYSL